MPFIAYLSQTLNKNNKPTTTHMHHTHMRSSSLSALRRPRTHQHPNQQVNPYGQSAYKVCAFLLNKMLASTIQLSTPTHLSAPASPHNPIRCSYRAPSGEGGTETTTQLVLCDSSGPNSVSGPDQVQEASGSTPTPEGTNSTEKHTRRPAGCSSTIPLASSTITTQPNVV